jgi:hypothetical protein
MEPASTLRIGAQVLVALIFAALKIGLIVLLVGLWLTRKPQGLPLAALIGGLVILLVWLADQVWIYGVVYRHVIG